MTTSQTTVERHTPTFDEMPGCVPVADPSGATVGCMDKAEQVSGLSGPQTPSASPTAYRAAVRSEPGGPIVGYMVSETGFVPNGLLDRADEIHGCEQSLKPGATLTPECRDLLAADRVPAAELAQH